MHSRCIRSQPRIRPTTHSTMTSPWMRFRCGHHQPGTTLTATQIGPTNRKQRRLQLLLLLQRLLDKRVPSRARGCFFPLLLLFLLPLPVEADIEPGRRNLEIPIGSREIGAVDGRMFLHCRPLYMPTWASRSLRQHRLPLNLTTVHLVVKTEIPLSKKYRKTNAFLGIELAQFQISDC